MKNLSTSKARVKREYKKICKRIDQRMIDHVGYVYCVSCGRVLHKDGRNFINWGHSHNLSVGRYPEFELVAENISPRCQNYGDREGCHEKLDSGDINKMTDLLDFHKIMTVRRVLCPVEYNLTITKMQDAGLLDDPDFADYQYLKIEK